MSQNQVHENHEMSHALYEDLAALKIRIAFAEISEAELDKYDRELSSVSESDYSEAAQKRALKLIEHKLNKRLRKQFVSKTLPHTLQIVTISLLLFFIGLTTAIATVRPVRLRIMDFIAHIEENYSSVSMVHSENDVVDVPEGWEGKYYPSYIPEGFTLEYIDDMYSFVRYSADNHRVIEFSEYESDDYSNFNIGNDNVFDITINGYACIAGVSKENVSITWGVEDSYYSLFYSGSFDEAKRIVESVQRIN